MISLFFNSSSAKLQMNMKHTHIHTTPPNGFCGTAVNSDIYDVLSEFDVFPLPAVAGISNQCKYLKHNFI